MAVLGLFLAGRAKESGYREVDEGQNKRIIDGTESLDIHKRVIHYVIY